MNKLKCKIVFIAIVVLCVALCVYGLRDRKQVVYVWFEDINGYSYKYFENSSGQDKYIRINKEGRFSYISWKLDIDIDNIQKFDRSFSEKFDRVSQYWIVNNFAGLRIELNPTRPDNYEINVVKEVGDSIYVYPISTLHYLIE